MIRHTSKKVGEMCVIGIRGQCRFAFENIIIFRERERGCE